MHLHLYQKAEPRPGRKMGHVTFVGDDLAQAIRNAEQFRVAVGMSEPVH